MAQKRMFDKTLIDSDLFIDLPIPSQCLYFHLSMRADDEGFIGNVKGIIRLVGFKEEDLRPLIDKKFIIIFKTGVIVIKHWKLNNYLRNDRIKQTEYKKERSLLSLNDNKYEFGIPNDNQLPSIGIPSIEENSIEENSIEENSIDIYTSDKSAECVKKIIEYLNLKTNSNYKHTSLDTKKHINARLNENFTLEEFKIVIDKKANEWLNTDMAKYLRPATLFGNKFESYLNQQEKQKSLDDISIDEIEEALNERNRVC